MVTLDTFIQPWVLFLIVVLVKQYTLPSASIAMGRPVGTVTLKVGFSTVSSTGTDWLSPETWGIAKAEVIADTADIAAVSKDKTSLFVELSSPL